jgi:hypothetical protein
MEGTILNITEPMFTERRTGHLLSYPGARNTISITLTSNVNFITSTILNVTGMYGASAPLGSIAIQSTDNEWAGQWDQDRSQLTVSNRDNIEAEKQFVFRVEMTNRVGPQPRPVLHVSASKSDGQRLVHATELFSEPGSQGTLAIDGKAFVTRYIEQHTSKPNAINTITVTLSPNFQVPNATSITILGLTGASPAGNGPSVLFEQGPLVPLTGSASQVFGGEGMGGLPHAGHGTWLEEHNGLALWVPNGMQQAADAVFSFQVRTREREKVELGSEVLWWKGIRMIARGACLCVPNPSINAFALEHDPDL